MIRVMVVDDEALVRSGFRLILDSAPDIEVVATCDGAAAVDQAARHRPQVVLLDLRMPRVDGLTVLRELRRRPEPPVVAMLTTFDTEDYIGQALTAGAAGFLLKDTEPEELIRAVRALAGGGSALSPTVARTVIAGYVHGSPDSEVMARIDAMTNRERDVLRLLGHGLPNAEIGTRLHLSAGTVKDHVSVVLAKLSVDNRVQAAVLARQAGMVPNERERPE